ncbi:hypothetical protein OUZ56_004051 [Daphnia magna]|uniref:Uncharacterized protein n=1 Tax=Daphnia magna TaxID=35525 RepID=A0ABQ9YNL5_9CRUS|nr:hypothetical protein OUZ56_004051 [Daphnia magna]
MVSTDDLIEAKRVFFSSVWVLQGASYLSVARNSLITGPARSGRGGEKDNTGVKEEITPRYAKGKCAV